LPTAQDRPLPFPYTDLRGFRALCDMHLTNSIGELRRKLVQAASAKKATPWYDPITQSIPFSQNMPHGTTSVSSTAASQKVHDLQPLETIWRQLLGDDLVAKTYQAARDAYAEALPVRAPRTKHFVQARSPGSPTRLMCVTSAPAQDVDGFIGYLSRQGVDYFQFIRPFRQVLHGLSEWRDTDFGHWIFLADSVHLFYVENLSSRLTRLGLTSLVGLEDGGPPVIAPVELVEDGNQLLSQIISDDDSVSPRRWSRTSLSRGVRCRPPTASSHQRWSGD